MSLDYKLTSDGKKILSVCMECTKVYAPKEIWPLPLDFVRASYEQAYKRALDDDFAISHGYCIKCYEDVKNSNKT